MNNNNKSIFLEKWWGHIKSDHFSLMFIMVIKLKLLNRSHYCIYCHSCFGHRNANDRNKWYSAHGVDQHCAGKVSLLKGTVVKWWIGTWGFRDRRMASLEKKCEQSAVTHEAKSLLQWMHLKGTPWGAEECETEFWLALILLLRRMHVRWPLYNVIPWRQHSGTQVCHGLTQTAMWCNSSMSSAFCIIASVPGAWLAMSIKCWIEM